MLEDPGAAIQAAEEAAEQGIENVTVEQAFDFGGEAAAVVNHDDEPTTEEVIEAAVEETIANTSDEM